MYEINYLLNSLSNTPILTSQLFNDEIDMSRSVHSSCMEYEIEISNWNEVMESKVK